MKFDIGFFEFSNGTIEVINFQSDAASILAREHSLGETFLFPFPDNRS